jgi:tRNA-binding EMAP/Myf-like protein
MAVYLKLMSAVANDSKSPAALPVKKLRIGSSRTMLICLDYLTKASILNSIDILRRFSS